MLDHNRLLPAEHFGQVRLTVCVDEQDTLTLPRKSCAQIDRRGALAHAALLVYDCNGLHNGFIS